MNSSGTSTATVVCTDVVDASAHGVDRDAAGSGQQRREHDDLVRVTVERFGGRVLRTGGRGTTAVFAAASDAVAMSVAFQRSVGQRPDPRRVRVGLAAGDVSWDGGDCFGTPLVVAARLEGAAAPGQIIAAAGVRLMAGDRTGITYRRLGPMALDGLDGAVEAFEIEPSFEAQATSTWTFPPTLPTSVRPFVGREAELDTMRAAWGRVAAGGSEIVLIGGEAGAGKTRLATELARELHIAGAIVLSGLNDSELSLPYQPWIMVIDQLLNQLSAAALQQRHDDLAVLRVLDPRIERHVRGLGPSEPVDPETQRHLLLLALASLLAGATEHAPTVLVLDDLHWAGRQTLDVLRYVARTVPVPRLLIVGTFRDTPDEVDDALSTTLADLRRLDRATRVKLGGLDPDSVLELVTAGRPGAAAGLDDLAAVITERTGGNPFLVSQLATHLDDPGGGDVPDSVIEVVAARTHRLSTAARRLAAVVAVAGKRVDLAVLGDAAGLGGDLLAASVSELVASGLVDEVTELGPAYQYAHALLRDAVAASLAGPERSQIHLALARAIERAHESDRRFVLPDLARHYAASAGAGGREKAIYYGGRAAAQARQTAAYDQGVSVLRAVLDAVPGTGPDQVDIAIELMDLLLRSGRHLEAGAMGRQAFVAARAMGDLPRQAAVAMQYERVGNLSGGGGREIREILELVLADAAESEPRVRIRLQSALGRARCLAGEEGADELIESSLAEARRLGDPEVLAVAVEMSLFADQRPEVRLERCHELERLTTSLQDPWSAMWATGNRVAVLFTMGRLPEAAAALDAHREIASRYRFFLFQFMSHVLESVLAQAAGRFDDAETAAEAADAIGLSDDELADSGVYGLVMFCIRREQGRLAEMRPVLSLLARTERRAGVWSPGAALAAAELGMLDEARASYESVAPGGFAIVPRDHVWPAALAFLSETAVLIGEEQTLPVLLEELARFAGLTLMAGFTTCLGPADRLRAALSELAGRREDADRCISAARDLATRAGSPVWLAHVERTHAWILARRGDRDAATAHEARAVALAEPIGLRSVLDRPVVLGVRPDRAASSVLLPDGLSPREIDVLGLVATGASNRGIAEQLLISPNTAANHVRSILQKTASANRAEAAAYAVRHGLAPSR